MPDYSKLRNELSKLEKLEREINLKQLQINRLLTITQAINNNVSAGDLYEMYNSFLSWEMGVKKMALYVQQDKVWVCATSIGVEKALLEEDLSELLPKYQRMKNLEEDLDHPLISQFDVVVPVSHKDQPIAYTFIGGFEKDNDLYNKMRFITTISNIIAVAIENKRLFKEQLDQERIQREVELGGDMQKMLIPSEFPKSEVFELSSIYIPMLGVGGDYFDFVEFPDDKFAFCIADISGKGIAAALLMANFQANFHSLIHQRAALDEFVKDLNHSLFRITKGDKFLTLFLAEFDKATYTLRYVNAGHNQPILAMNEQVQKLDKGCTLLGAFPDIKEVEIGTVQIDKEALILSFTDGLSDVRDDNGTPLHEDFLPGFVRQYELASASIFNEKLMEEINRYKGKQDFPDDITVLTCKIFSRT